MNPGWCIRTGRLDLRPVVWGDLQVLTALKGNPAIYGQMLGGIRTPAQCVDEMTADVRFWGANGVGMWTVRDQDVVIGLTGVHQRLDGRGLALRFAFHDAARGRGLAREAAGAALRFAHERASVPRVVAVAKVSNIGSRTLLGAIGMRECERFVRDGEPMLTYESRFSPPPAAAWRR